MVAAIKAGVNIELGDTLYWNQTLAVKKGDLTEVRCFVLFYLFLSCSNRSV